MTKSINLVNIMLLRRVELPLFFTFFPKNVEPGLGRLCTQFLFNVEGIKETIKCSLLIVHLVDNSFVKYCQDIIKKIDKRNFSSNKSE